MKGKGRADGLRLNAAAAANAENAKRDAELRAQYVVVPPGDEAKPISCPICKETLKSEFLEDDEDWVWKNAVLKDERVRLLSSPRSWTRPDIEVRRQVYHATCHAEALTSTNTLAARLRTEIANASRGTTPESAPIRSTPLPSSSITSTSTSKSPSLSPLKVGGTKRKADDSESNVENEAAGTPPLKKLALSTAAS
jgi:pre-mRNA cleavage complex 2 protein Pcf11